MEELNEILSERNIRKSFMGNLKDKLNSTNIFNKTSIAGAIAICFYLAAVEFLLRDVNSSLISEILYLFNKDKGYQGDWYPMLITSMFLGLIVIGISSPADEDSYKPWNSIGLQITVGLGFFFFGILFVVKNLPFSWEIIIPSICGIGALFYVGNLKISMTRKILLLSCLMTLISILMLVIAKYP